MDELTLKYRAVFLDHQPGRDVLADILSYCHFGEVLDSENKQQIAENGVGMLILHRCGIFAEGTMDDVLRALAMVMPHTEETD